MHRRIARSALMLVALVLAALPVALAFADPQPAPAVVKQFTFETGDPNTADTYILPGSSADVNSWWGVAAQSHTGVNGLWVAGNGGVLPNYLGTKTAGMADFAIPDTSAYFLSDFSYWYEYPGFTAQPANPFYALGWVPSPLDPKVAVWTVVGEPHPLAATWTKVSFNRTGDTGQLSSAAGWAKFTFNDWAGSGSAKGPTIDDVQVTGYLYGPVRSLAASRDVDTSTTVDLSWDAPTRFQNDSSVDTRAINYRIWRKSATSAGYTEIGPVPSSAGHVTAQDTSAPVNVAVNYYVQGYNGPSLADWGQLVISPTVAAMPGFGPTKTVDRISGSNRYVTAIQTGLTAYPRWSGVKHLVLASGDYGHQPDALTAAGLAGAYNAPLLLVPATSLDANVKAAILAMPKGVQVHIVGGTPSVSAAVATKIKALSSVKSVDRISGTDRYATAAAVATRMKSVLGGGFPSTALITNGASTSLLFDPLIASTVSASRHFPVLLVNTGAVPSPTKNALSSLHLTTRFVVGGTGAVPESVRSSLSVPVGNRIAGVGVSGDAAAFADKAKLMGWLANSYVGFAAAVPDAATGGAYMGKRGGALLLVSRDAIPAVTSGYLNAHRTDILGGCVFGGAPSVSETVRSDLAGFMN